MQDAVNFLLYGNVPQAAILQQLFKIQNAVKTEPFDREELTAAFYRQVRALLQLASDYGFTKNLWQRYLAYLLAMDENPFSLACEKVGAGNGSLDRLAMHDIRIFRRLFFYDFNDLRGKLDAAFLPELLSYESVPQRRGSGTAGENIEKLSDRLARATDDQEFFAVLTAFYRECGVGMLGLNKAFRVLAEADGKAALYPTQGMEPVLLDDLIGYEEQKEQLVANTRAFTEGKRANNVLLYGDSGTGKSTSIKAIVNEFYASGLRMIEIYKHQFRALSDVIAQIKDRNYKFVIFMDDLSFEDFEIEYKYLKAVIEGGVEAKPENVVIYATSNRRHLIKEIWKDRDDMERTDDEIHRSDTMEEKLSLVHRFGITIRYSKPSKDDFYKIVSGLAKRNGILLDEAVLRAEANRWEMRHGGVSGRTAQQFIDYLLSADNR